MKLAYQKEELKIDGVTFRIGDKIRYRKRKMISRGGCQMEGPMITDTGYIYVFCTFGLNDIIWVSEDKGGEKLKEPVHAIAVIEKI